MDQTEAEIEFTVNQYIKKKGGRSLKLRIDGENGYPDRTVLLPDTPSFTIEFKKPSGRPSDKQIYWHRILNQNGHRSFIVDNVYEAQMVVDHMFHQLDLNPSVGHNTVTRFL